MKRTFAEANLGTSIQNNAALYGPEQKRKKLESQRIGDFIVNALDAFHFKIVSNITDIDDQNCPNCAPKFLYWVSFGLQKYIPRFWRVF